MAAINDLINQIENPELRERIQQEVDRMNKQKKFGLVFEEHLPECTPLYDVPVRKGSAVALKTGKVSETYVVVQLADGKATCLPKVGGESVTFAVDTLVSVAEFGEPIYPYLKPIDTVCNAPDSDLWHTLIEADNYHALQLLEYLYAGKVDCIYIDPPYNTGARDWKYNNDYVDGNDTYRHSKWLSMMQKRLKIAKKLLNLQDSVLIVTIDEKEYLHLGCLLEEMFPEAKMQMVSISNNQAGVQRALEFSRVDEYAFFIMLGESSPQRMPLSSEWIKDGGRTNLGEIRWDLLRRTGTNAQRSNSPGCFYPIFISPDGKRIIGTGETLPFGKTIDEYDIPIDGSIALWPIRQDGSDGRWQLSQDSFNQKKSRGLIKLGPYKGENTTVYYLKPAEEAKLSDGTYTIEGYSDDGSVITSTANSTERKAFPTTQWRISSHDATHYGTRLIKKFIPGREFAFPKSLYAVHDSLMFFAISKPNALIVDFFAGSGTTLHAVNLLNAEDGGHRRCIMVTNNEVSDDEAKALTAQGHNPGDPEWEKLGIAHYVTWPRTVCSIEGHDVNGIPLKGEYLGSELSMADGFKANAAFFKLSFLDKNAVALGRQFKEMLPTLWMKAGAHGACPTLKDDATPIILVLPENHMAVLTQDAAFTAFAEQVNACLEIETVYLVTDYEAGYCAMAKNLNAPYTFQLYRDYLDNFRINLGRN